MEHENNCNESNDAAGFDNLGPVCHRDSLFSDLVSSIPYDIDVNPFGRDRADIPLIHLHSSNIKM